MARVPFLPRSLFLSATAAAFLIVLRWRIRARYAARLIKHPKYVGQRIGSKATDEIPEYDVIIIGGGTSGCVLASRLSEDPKVRVLLLEAGTSGVANVLTLIPLPYYRLFHTKADYDFYTVPQEHAGHKAKYWPRAKLLGGCSSLNAAMFHYGAPSDYDEWATSDVPESQSWGYKDFQRYFLKFEHFAPSDVFPLVDSTLRGADGPVTVGYHGHFSQVAKNFIAACEAIGIAPNPDVNTFRGTLGATKIMTYTCARGRRVSTERAYLTQEVQQRPNLKVAVNSTVTRILFETVDGTTRAVGVEFASGKSGPRFRARAKKEVIVSAGAVHSPHILMLSGVGPAEQLTQHQIPVVRDLRGVGQHLMDHPVVNVRFRDTIRSSLNYLDRPRSLTEVWNLLKACVTWTVKGKGPLTSNVAEAAAFLRSTDPALFPPEEYSNDLEDSTSGPIAPDIEFVASPIAWTDHGHGLLPPGDLVSFGAVLLRPTSTGTLTLKSNNPFEAPVLDPKYLTTQHDVEVLLRGLKLLLRVIQKPQLASTLDATEKDPLLDHNLYQQSDDQLRSVVRERAETLYHPTSTCRMAPLSDDGVVDYNLAVHGIPNLRVVDASIFPTIMAGHTAAPCIAVAEKAADIIKASL